MANQFPYGGKRPYFKRNFGKQKYRKNDRIRVPKVRVIGPDGSQIGVLDTRKALDLAKKHGLDLVEVSPTAKPPVCRILSFGKFMYDESKKTKGTKTQSTKLKEVKFRVNIDENDYNIKLRRGESFLNHGDKLKVTLSFRGREMEHKDRGFDIIKRVVKDLEDMGSPDYEPKLMGRNISLTFTPLPENRRKLKFNLDSEEIDEPVENDSE